MAHLVGIEFTGSLGDFSAYRMRGSDKITLRKKGGASKEKIKTSLKFANTRRNMSEFGGCSTMGKQVRLMMGTVKTLADYNISGHINKFLKVVQKQDMVNDWGQRSILLSNHPQLLEGFSLNKLTPFDSVIRNTLTWSIEKETGVARIDIPALMRDINFFSQNRHPLFRITASLGIVPDFTFNEATKRFEPPAWYNAGFAAAEASTPWYPALEGSPATTLEVALKNIPADGAYSLMLSIGISFGTLYNGGVIVQVKRTGAAKILALRGGDVSALLRPDDYNTKKDTHPVSAVTPGTLQDLKDNRVEDSAAIKNTATSTAFQYVYTLRREHSAGDTHAQVYTYTIERKTPAQIEPESTAIYTAI